MAEEDGRPDTRRLERPHLLEDEAEAERQRDL